MNDGKPQTQAERFAEAARKLGADEDEGRFRERLAQIARQKPVGAPAAEPPAEPKKPRRR